MRVRSGFKKNQKNHRKQSKALFVYVQKKVKRILKSPVFIDPIKRVFKKKTAPRRRANTYLKRDCLKKELHNPYQKKKKTQIKTLVSMLQQKRFGISLVILGLIVSLLGISLFTKPTFYLTRISLSGLTEIPEPDVTQIIQEQLDKRSYLLIKRSHLFFLSEKRIEEAIRDKYGLESITFDTHWPSRSLMIKLKEKTSVLAYSVDDDYFTMDKSGSIIKSLDQASLEQKTSIPLIYQYGADEPPLVGDHVMTEGNIQTILDLYTALQTYDALTIHSFRLRPIEKRTVIIPEKNPILNEVDESIDTVSEQALDDLADSIAHASTVEEKISEIKSALEEIDIKKLEEGEIERYLETERVYEPDDSYQFQELEIYTVNGWSIKLGAKIFDDPTELEKFLDIFATLNQEVDLAGEIKDYIDLRFPDRVYYR
jgi:cell division septal protein FtsQ